MAGKVILVGAGPGDAGLLTVKGRRALEQAEVVVFDRLVDGEIMKLIPANAERIDVGKNVANHPVPQPQINQILLEKAQEGKRVVRLKGGDCFVFGRGGEELELLAEHGVDFEVVPGITSALAAAAYAGIPATHRDYCASVHIITGHRRRNERLELDYDALVRLNGTLIFLMSVATFGEIAEGLIAAGMDRAFPCGIVENGTRPEQRKVITTVGDAAASIQRENVHSPAIFVVGRVCELSEQMDWFDALPLKGKRVLVARPREDSHRMTEMLKARGARAIELPAIRTEFRAFDLPASPANLVLSCPDAVDALFAQLERMDADVRVLARYAIVCEGARAEKALRERGLRPDAPNDGWPTARLCCEGEAGIPAWRRIRPKPVEGEIDADFVVFTTLSSIEAFRHVMAGRDCSGLRAVCIGAQTAQAARKLGLEAAQAAVPTRESVVERLEALCRECASAE